MRMQSRRSCFDAHDMHKKHEKKLPKKKPNKQKKKQKDLPKHIKRPAAFLAAAMAVAPAAATAATTFLDEDASSSSLKRPASWGTFLKKACDCTFSLQLHGIVQQRYRIPHVGKRPHLLCKFVPQRDQGKIGVAAIQAKAPFGQFNT